MHLYYREIKGTVLVVQREYMALEEQSVGIFP